MEFNTLQQRYRDQEITDQLKREEDMPVMKYVTISCYVEIEDDENKIAEKEDEIEAVLEEIGASKIRVDFTTIKIKRG